jgi:hypothetical protein
MIPEQTVLFRDLVARRAEEVAYLIEELKTQRLSGQRIALCRFYSEFTEAQEKWQAQRAKLETMCRKILPNALPVSIYEAVKRAQDGAKNGKW